MRASRNGFRIVEMADLSAAEVDRWLELRASHPELDSPYFHPGFSAAVAGTRSGVRVIVQDGDAGDATAFLPVQFDGRTCRPAGSPAADFQGPICAPDTDFELDRALWECGIASYRFDHLRDGVAGVEPWITARQPSPFMDISGGMEGYLARASRTGKDNIAQARRRARKAER
ncbi:MAG: hypothetical protein JO243_08760, partial [Solirubrobacterales bacterium]|nr:hypothetical protein [Solirubrobacterales bacterium]